MCFLCKKRFSQHAAVITLLFAVAGVADAGDLFVRQSGSDKNLGGTPKNALLTITHAATLAKPGDHIWVGAGDYTEKIVIGAANGASSKLSISIHGDVDGKQTGDKGAVIVRAPEKYWALSVSVATTVNVDNVTFAAPVGSNGVGYGCRAYADSSWLSFSNCYFTGLRISVYPYNGASASVSQCSFEDNVYGVYGRASQAIKIGDSAFFGNTYACYLVDVPKAYASGCKFGPSKLTPTHRSFTVYRSGFSVDNCGFDSPSFAVYGIDCQWLDVQSCEIQEPTSYGIYATGEKLSVSSVKIIGAGDRIGTGMMLNDTSNQEVTVKDVHVDGLRYGAIAMGSDYDFQDVSLNNCYYGYYCHPNKPSLSISGSDKVEMKGNYIGLYSYHRADAPGKVEISDREFDGNEIGFMSYNDHLALRGCAFHVSRIGAYVRLGASTDIRECKFVNDGLGIHTSTYGLYLDSNEISVEDCGAYGNRIGMYMKSSFDRAFRLRNLDCDDNEYMSLYLVGGSWDWSDGDNIQLTNSRYGVYANNVDWTVKGIGIDASTLEYPIVDVYGNLVVAGSKISGGSHGVYGSLSESLTVTDSHIAGAKSYGIRSNRCESITLDGVSSTGNGHSGLYCYSIDDVPLSVSNSVFADNVYYGMYLNGLTLDPKVSANLKLTGNRYALRVHNRDLTLTEPMNVVMQDNDYAAMCYYGDLTIRGLKISDNGVAAYSYRGSLDLTDSVLSASNYGAIAYPEGSVLINQCEIDTARYGIYLAPYGDLGQELSVTNTKLTDLSHMGIYVRSYQGSDPVLELSNVDIENSRYGIYSSYSTVNSTDCNITNCTTYGIAQIHGSGDYRNTRVESTGSWSVLAYGDDFQMTNGQVIGPGYGIVLFSKKASVINSVVRDTYYGIRLDGVDAQYDILQSTIGNIRYYGVWHRNGNTVLRNSVVDADYYALWNQTGNGTLSNDHNLVHADRQAFVNTTPGDGDIEKDPIFLDPAAGDLHLAAGSPAINAGTDLSDVVIADIEGNERPSFRQFEMGAYEFTDAAGSLRVLDWDEVAK
tara:strand:+ start:240125 stop:243256 length:3132 start_codon:yes stop_codon:yes gene_type:complete